MSATAYVLQRTTRKIHFHVPDLRGVAVALAVVAGDIVGMGASGAASLRARRGLLVKVRTAEHRQQEDLPAVAANAATIAGAALPARVKLSGHPEAEARCGQRPLCDTAGNEPGGGAAQGTVRVKARDEGNS
jgi:hypothetical protein